MIEKAVKQRNSDAYERIRRIMAKEKRLVYNGYDEKYMTGQEIIDTFSEAYELFGRHHDLISSHRMDWKYKPLVKPEKTYRVFVNDTFCCILDSETDRKLYFFGYTMQPPPWAKDVAQHLEKTTSD